MKEHKLFLKQRWNGLLINLANLILREEGAGKITQGELNYFLYCLEQLKQNQAPDILTLLVEQSSQFDSLDASANKAVWEIISSTDWTRAEEEKRALRAIREIILID